MVQWYNKYTLLHFLQGAKSSSGCISVIYKISQTISGTLIPSKTPKNTIFSAKNASKNTVFTSFFIKNHQKLLFFIQKLGQILPKNQVFNHFCTGHGTTCTWL
jgi:hypothetical protein